MSGRRRANVVGLGLIGGSIGMALRDQGWTVTGYDRDASHSARALELGAIDAVGTDPHADASFVATPVKSVAEAHDVGPPPPAHASSTRSGRSAVAPSRKT